MRFYDAHSDIIIDLTARRAAGERNVFRRRHLERLRRGGCVGGVLALWNEPKYRGCEARHTAEMLSAVQAEAAEDAAALRLVRTAGELAEAEEDGPFTALLGAEGLAAIGRDPGLLEAYYAQGVRLAMLTWNEANALAAGAMSGEDTGLTEAGVQVILRMQKLGMAVDVSHLNERGFWDIMDLADGPVLASHSNCGALCPVPRNLTDDQLRAIRNTGGVVGLNAYRGFVAEAPEDQTALFLARHAAHMADVMGVEHVCCGFDFCEFFPDEGPCNVTGMDDCGEAGAFFDCLARVGFTERERALIARENLLRVLRTAIC